MIKEKYEDKRGRVVTVENIENNIAELNNGERIAVERLRDRNFYKPLNLDEQSNKNQPQSSDIINENNDTPSRYQNLINNFQSNNSADIGIVEESTINPNNTTPGTNPGVNISTGNSVIESHSDNLRSIGKEDTTSDKRIPVTQPYKPQQPKQEPKDDIYNDNLEDRTNNVDPKQALIDKYKIHTPKTDTKLNEIVHGKESDDSNDDNNDDNSDENIKPTKQPSTQPKMNPSQKIEREENPVHQMFDKAKKTHSISVNLKLDEKIPEKNVIKMMEENFDESAIDYYTNEIFIKLMETPEIIETQVKEAINKYVNSRSRKKTK